MNSLNKENKERLLIYNKILQIKPNLEFKFYDKLTKNYLKIINNFVEILNMIEKEIRNIQVILCENKTVHQLVANLFTNEEELNGDGDKKQMLYLELVNINQKINLYNTIISKSRTLTESPCEYFYPNNKAMILDIMKIYDDILNKIE